MWTRLWDESVILTVRWGSLWGVGTISFKTIESDWMNEQNEQKESRSQKCGLSSNGHFEGTEKKAYRKRQAAFQNVSDVSKASG